MLVRDHQTVLDDTNPNDSLGLSSTGKPPPFKGWGWTFGELQASDFGEINAKYPFEYTEGIGEAEGYTLGYSPHLLGQPL